MMMKLVVPIAIAGAVALLTGCRSIPERRPSAGRVQAGVAAAGPACASGNVLRRELRFYPKGYIPPGVCRPAYVRSRGL